MKKTTLSALVIALAATSAFAAAPVTNTTAPAPTPATHPAGPEHGGMGGEHKGPGHMFDDTDANHDGFISKEEWTAKGDKMFADIDANKDGKLSEDEMKAHHDMMRAKFEQRKAEGEKPASPAAGIKTPATNAAPKN